MYTCRTVKNPSNLHNDHKSSTGWHLLMAKESAQHGYKTCYVRHAKPHACTVYTYFTAGNVLSPFDFVRLVGFRRMRCFFQSEVTDSHWRTRVDGSGSTTDGAQCT